VAITGSLQQPAFFYVHELLTESRPGITPAVATFAIPAANHDLTQPAGCGAEWVVRYRHD
jgi:hypothetical protein